MESYDRDKIRETAAKYFLKNNYMFLKFLGAGAFGEVVAIKKESDAKIIAAKLMHKDYTSPGEVYLWPCLRHPNVLPLEKRICYKNTDIFLTPYHPTSLHRALKSPKFRQSPELFEITLGWIKGFMTGLEYLHEYGVCHWDLKADNILITSEGQAVICDFSGIAETKDFVNG